MAIRAKTTLVRAAVCLLALGSATAWAADPALEIREQPTDVRRPNVVAIEWAGEAVQVVVERKHGLFWLVAASDASGEVRVEDVGDDVWAAHWQAGYYSRSGTYRMRVQGHDEDVISEEFEVRPCRCVIPNPLRANWRDGRFRMSVTATYAPGPFDGFLELPTEVTTGRPLVRVIRNGRRIGSVRLRYEREKFRGTWAGRRGPRHSVVFQLVSLTDGVGNSLY